MILDQKQKQFWNRHAKRNNNPRDANVSVLLGAFVSRSTPAVGARWNDKKKVVDKLMYFYDKLQVAISSIKMEE